MLGEMLVFWGRGSDGNSGRDGYKSHDDNRSERVHDIHDPQSALRKTLASSTVSSNCGRRRYLCPGWNPLTISLEERTSFFKRESSIGENASECFLKGSIIYEEQAFRSTHKVEPALDTSRGLARFTPPPSSYICKTRRLGIDPSRRNGLSDMWEKGADRQQGETCSALTRRSAATTLAG